MTDQHKQEIKRTKGGDQQWVVDGWAFWTEQFYSRAVSDKRALWELESFLRMFNRNEAMG